jgi:hypothetical protein
MTLGSTCFAPGRVLARSSFPLDSPNPQTPFPAFTVCGEGGSGHGTRARRPRREEERVARRGRDCFPLDSTRWQCPPPVGGDTTPPVITLTEPTNASLISSVP